MELSFKGGIYYKKVYIIIMVLILILMELSFKAYAIIEYDRLGDGFNPYFNGTFF